MKKCKNEWKINNFIIINIFISFTSYFNIFLIIIMESINVYYMILLHNKYLYLLRVGY